MTTPSSDGAAIGAPAAGRVTWTTKQYVGRSSPIASVWVAKDIETAKRLYKQQADVNVKMPERDIDANGPFPWVIRRGAAAEGFL